MYGWFSTFSSGSSSTDLALPALGIIEFVFEEAADLVGAVMCFITISAEYCASVSLVSVPPCMSAPITWCAHHWCAISCATT